MNLRTISLLAAIAVAVLLVAGVASVVGSYGPNWP